MNPHLIPLPKQVEPGYTPITRMGERQGDTGISFGLLRLAAGQRYRPSPELEGALLLLDGPVRFAWADGEARRTRRSVFDEDPVALHVPSGSEALVEALDRAELAVFSVRNEGDFPATLFDGASMLEAEHRGRGQLDDTAYRIVRTIFDGRNRPGARLVLGEVVNFPGRWSSYPPHHHPQPEIYHYRFSDPRGYGHGELGDEVLKIRHGDTVKILDERDHAQVAAPGYGMFYIWAIRHLAELPYTTPEFAAEHRWLLEPDAPVWTPRGGKP